MAIGQTSVLAESGQLIVGVVDGVVDGPLLQLEIKRTYRSFQRAEGLFGRGWCSPFEDILENQEPEHEIRYRPCGSGQATVFEPAGRGQWRATDGRVLTKKDGQYLLRTGSMGSLSFDEGGRLVAVQNGIGPAATLHYKNARLSSVSAPAQGKLDFTLDEEGRIKSISDGQRKARYEYQAGRLVKATNFWGNTYEYRSDPNGWITRIGYPDKTQELISYDSRGRVTKLTDRLKCEEKIVHPSKSGNPVVVEKKCDKEVVARNEFPSSVETTGSPPKGTREIHRGSRILRVRYDAASGRASEIRSQSTSEGSVERKFAYRYDDTGRITSILLDGGEELQPTFRKNGQVSNLIHKKNRQVISSYEWGPTGELTVKVGNKTSLRSQPEKNTVRRPVRQPAGTGMRGLLQWTEAMSLLEDL